MEGFAVESKLSRRDVLKTGIASAVAAGAAGQTRADAGKAEEESVASDAQRLPDYAITHGGVQHVDHPRLGTQVPGQTCIRYLRFGRAVRLDRLELGRVVYGRWIPSVPTHPAHVVVSTLDERSQTWKTLREVDLPPDPRISGEGLSQQMSAQEMEERLRPVLSGTPHVIALDGLETDHLRIVCDREHPVWPNHGECNGGLFNVPFGILNELHAYGVPLAAPYPIDPPAPILKRDRIDPKAPKGMRVHTLPDMVRYEGKHLSIGFSLRRPMLMHLGWDAVGKGQAANNRLLVSRKRSTYNITGGVSGPMLRTLQRDYPPSLWTGEVSVEGNRVRYGNLRAIDGWQLDVEFIVLEDRVTLALTQTCSRDIPVVEAEAWRLSWDLTKGITGLAGVPSLRTGRNGDVTLPALWATDGVGCLACRTLEDSADTCRVQVESYRDSSCVTGGFVFGEQPAPAASHILPAGTRHAAIECAVSNLTPNTDRDVTKASEGLARHWATVFSCFRPEHRGFSNHSASTNCHLSQGPPLEIVAHTKRPEYGPDPLDLARATIGRALLDGGGYGYWRNLYLDSDPVLLSAAGRIHQAGPDTEWLKQIEPGLIETVERILSQVGDDGLLVCKDLSGNSGSYRWSSNSMDVVGFGHIDGYVNAWAYRGLRNAAALLSDLSGQNTLAARCREAATRLRESYAAALLNPATGWVAGWRSRDGQLHDFGFTWVNGVALAFGLLNEDASRNALTALERKRERSGPPDARLGLPCNLLPIPETDQKLPQIVNHLQPTFETYTDGSLSGWPATYYLRALSIHGLRDEAKKLAIELADGYAAGIFNGGFGAGHEFRSWEGLPTGYEGTLIGCFGPLYGIAIEEGFLTPSQPEWWPENG
jgi:hypothetical protein